MTNKMNPEVKVLWLAALRSGEYEQGASALKRGGKYCCLGVLCDLHAKKFGGKWYDSDEIEGSEYHDEFAVAPNEVCDWADIDPYGHFSTDDSLTNYNDGNPQLGIVSHTFAQIADIIEEHM